MTPSPRRPFQDSRREIVLRTAFSFHRPQGKRLAVETRLPRWEATTDVPEATEAKVVA